MCIFEFILPGKYEYKRTIKCLMVNYSITEQKG